jgi:hypothetical protein
VRSIAPLDRCPQGLTEITPDHHAIEGRLETDAPELLVHQSELGPGLIGARLADDELRPVCPGHGGSVGVLMLGKLAAPLVPFKLKDPARQVRPEPARP